MGTTVNHLYAVNMVNQWELHTHVDQASMINAINKPCQHMSTLINNDNTKDFNLIEPDCMIGLNASVNTVNTGELW